MKKNDAHEVDSASKNFHETLSYTTQQALHELLSGLTTSWKEASSRANLLRLALHSEISITSTANGYTVHMLEEDYLCLLLAANEETLDTKDLNYREAECQLSFTSWFNTHIQI